MVNRTLSLILGSLLACTVSLAVAATKTDPNNITGSTGLVMIDKRGNLVRFFDPATLKETGTVDIGGPPHELAISPDHMAIAPHGLRVDDKGLLHAVCDLSRRLLIIDPKSKTVQASIDIEGTGHWLAVLPDGSRLLTTTNGVNVLNVLDAANLRGRQRVVPVGPDPFGVAFTRDGRTALVSNHGDGTISVVDVASGTAKSSFTAGIGIETLSFF
jgi:DNA-binding beta-propeller fold protein YncE